MWDLSCLSRPSGPAEALLLSQGWSLTLVVILALALLLSVVASPFVQRAYRRRIVRLMGFNQTAPRPSLWWSAQGAASELSPGAGRIGSDSAGDASGLSETVSGRERRVAANTLLAWAVFVLVAFPVAHCVLANGPRSYQALFVVAAGALALGPAFVNLPQRFALRALLCGLVACAVAAALIVGFAAPETVAPEPRGEPDDPGALETAIGVFAAALAYLGIFHRRLRGLVLPVFVIVAVALLLFVLPLGFAEPHLGACLAEVTEHGQISPSAPFLAAVGTLVPLAAWLGFKALDGLARVVAKGWLSELSLIGLVSLVLIAMTLVAAALAERDAPSSWLAWLPLPWSAAALAAYALGLGRRRPREPGPRLLVLRVFAHDRKQLKLLDELQSRWRYVGPVHQIGGPDLATTNVDPHECALFLVGRLHDLFLPAAASPEQLRGRVRADADREGRYSISEVFCFNSAWQDTVEQLMHISEAIVLDLRGLTAKRAGTSYELRVLARTGLLDKVVALGDGNTDWALVDRLLSEEGQEPERLRMRIAGPDLRSQAVFDHLLRLAERSKHVRPGSEAEPMPHSA